jgi:hypothetical protein
MDQTVEAQINVVVRGEAMTIEQALTRVDLSLQEIGELTMLKAIRRREPFFILLARDPQAPGTVRQWAYSRQRAITTGLKPVSDVEKVKSAYFIAEEMEKWQQLNKLQAPK